MKTSGLVMIASSALDGRRGAVHRCVGSRLDGPRIRRDENGFGRGQLCPRLDIVAAARLVAFTFFFLLAPLFFLAAAFLFLPLPCFLVPACAFRSPDPCGDVVAGF